VVVYRADATTCNACPVRAACTASPHGRQVRRSFHAEYLDRVRGYHRTEAYKKAMRKRAVWVEPLFGEAKQWHGLRTFRLRGLSKVNTEALLVSAGENLKRYLVATGWGRRHAPCGALQLPRPAQRLAICWFRVLADAESAPSAERHARTATATRRTRDVSHQAAWLWAPAKGIDSCVTA
jgi:hypothetical protein